MALVATVPALAQDTKDSRETKYAPGYSPKALALYRQQAREDERRLRQKEEKRRSPEAVAARLRSRLDHRDKSRAESRALLNTSFPDVLKQLEEDGGQPFDDATDFDFANDYMATVDRPGKEPALIYSTLPLRAETEAGVKRPVDLDLVEQGGEWEPENPLVATALPRQLSDGVAVGSSGLGFEVEGLPGGEQVEGTRDGERVFYPDVAADTDLALLPVSTGVETLTQIRSPQAPEVQRLRLRMPDGAKARLNEDLATVEIVQGDRLIGLVRSPFAVDADHQDIPVTYALDGDVLELRVPHRSEDVTYPVLVDPIIEEWNQNFAAWTDSWGQINQWPAQFTMDRQGTCASGSGTCNGLASNSRPNFNFSNQYAQWRWTSFRTVFIGEAWFNSSRLGVGSENNVEMHQGIWSERAGYWTAFTNYRGPVTGRNRYLNARYGDGFTYGRDGIDRYTPVSYPDWQGGNLALHSLYVPGPVYKRQWAQAYVGNVKLALGDPEDPFIEWVGWGLRPSCERTCAAGQGGTWVGDINVSGEINARDAGAGIKRIQLLGPGLGWYPKYDRYPDCWNNNGNRFRRCEVFEQHWVDYNTSSFPEGANRLTARTWDATDKIGDWAWDVKVDRTPPGLQELSGALWDVRDQSLSGDSYSVWSAVGDSRSGVGRVELRVDNQMVDYLGDCGGDGCSQRGTLTWRPAGWADGEHTVTIWARDRRGSPGAIPAELRSWKVIVDRDAPSVDPVEHTGLPTGWFDTATPSARVVAHDRGAGVKRSSVETVAGGSRQTGREEQCAGTVPSRCPTDPAADNITYNRAGNLLPQGIVSLRARAEDASNPSKAGYSAATWTARVDHTPPVNSEPTGTLMAGRDGAATADSPTLRVEATDNPAATADPQSPDQARSGVASIRVSVDGQTRPEWTKLAACTPGGCPMRDALDITFLPGQLADGRHEIEIVTKDQLGDQAGHTDTDSFSVLVDRNAPTGVSAEQRDLPSGWINDDAQPKTRIFAEDLGTGVKSVGIDGRFSGSLRPPGEVDWTGPIKTYDCAGTLASRCPSSLRGAQVRTLRPAPEPGDVLRPGSADDYTGTEGYRTVPEDEVEALPAPAGPGLVDDPIATPAEVEWYISDHLELGSANPAARIGLSNAPVAPGERVTSLRAWALTGHRLAGEDPDIEAGSNVRLELFDTVNGRSLATTTASSPAAWRSLDYALPAAQTLTQQELDGLQLRVSGSGALLYVAYIEVTSEPATLELTYNEPANRLPEGVLTLRGVVRDAATPAHEATTGTWPVKVDRTAPEVVVTGSLKEREEQSLTEPTYGVHVEATDRSSSGPRAGVERIELLVDEERQGLPAIQLCPAAADSCPLTADFVFLAGQYDDGVHDITVRSTDRAGNVRDTNWEVYVDGAGRSLEDEGEQPGYELKSLREPQVGPPDTKTFVDESGLHTELVRGGSRFYEDADGASQERINTLEPVMPLGESYRNGANDYVAELPKTATGRVRYTAGGASVEFTMVGAAAVDGAVEGNASRFLAVFPGVDVTYAAEDDALEEELRLNSRAAQSTFTYAVSFSPELNAQQNDAGGIDFLGPEGDVRFSFDAPVMIDSKAPVPAFSRAATLSLTPGAAGQATVTLSADRNWIEDPARQLPVKIDPTIRRYQKSAGRWDPLQHVLPYGNVTGGDGKYCAPGVTDCNPEGKAAWPEPADFDRMPRDGVEYMRIAIYPCAYGGRERVDGQPLQDPYGEPTSPEKWMRHYDAVFREAAKRKIQFLPQIDQGLDCTHQPRDNADGTRGSDGTLSPMNNPPNKALEYEDLQKVSRFLAERYGPILEGKPKSGAFWRAQGCAAVSPRTGSCGPVYYLPVKVWQLWNEPNIRESWGPGPKDNPNPDPPPISAEHFREALFYAREGLRDADPPVPGQPVNGARILAGGLAAKDSPQEITLPDGSKEPHPDKQGAQEFLGDLLIGGPSTEKTGNHCAVDAVAMHFYERDGFPKARKETVRNFRRFMQEDINRPLRGAKGRTLPTENVPIWITELGAAAFGPAAAGKSTVARLTPNGKVRRSPAAQKRWLQEVFSLIESYRSAWRVGPVFHHQWQDTDKWDAEDVENDPSTPQNEERSYYFDRTGLWGEGGVTDPTKTRYTEATNVGRKPAGSFASDKGLHTRRLSLPPMRCVGYGIANR